MNLALMRRAMSAASAVALSIANFSVVNAQEADNPAEPLLLSDIGGPVHPAEELIDWDSDKGPDRPTYTSPLNPWGSLSLIELLLQNGHDISVHNLMPIMNWRDNLGSPVSQFDSTNVWPSVGQINMTRSDTSASLGYCSGTLINSRFFLTAAHCVRDGVTPTAFVRAGINFAPSTGGIFTGAGTRQAVSIATPGLYDPAAFFRGQDLAIVALDRPVYNIAGSPIATTELLGQSLTMVGYGLAGTGSVPNQIFDGRRRVGTNTHEGVYYFDISSTGTVIAADFEDPLSPATTNTLGISASVTTREAAVAPGDSGGPLFDASGRVLGVASGVITIGVSSWGYGSIPFWTNLTDAQYQAFIASNDPLRYSSSVSSGLWSNAGSWSGSVIPDNTFGNTDNPLTVADYTVGQRFFNVTIGGSNAITLNDSREVDQFSIASAATLSISSGTGDLGFWGSSSANGHLNVNGILRSFDGSGYGTLAIGGANARLSGSGSVLAPVVNASGTVAPGNSIGTLSVSSYTQSPFASIDIELTNGASDVLAISGNAQVAGTASFAAFGASPLLGQSYDFITTGGTVTGHFSFIEDLLPGALFPSVTYGSNYVRVTLANFCTFASGPVETPVCEALDSTGVQSDPDMAAGLLALQQLDSDQLADALEALNPTRANAQTEVGFSIGSLLLNQLGRRSHDLLGSSDAGQISQRDIARTQLASVSPSAESLASAASAAIATSASAPANLELANGYALFFAGDVANFEVDQAGGIGTDRGDAAALTAGLDHSDGKNFAAGVAVSYLQSNVNQDYGLGGHTSSDGFAASAYASVDLGDLYADLYASGAWHSFDTERSLLLAPHVHDIAYGETEASQVQAGASLGYNVARSERMTVGAVGGLYYINLDIDGYAETGAGPMGAVLTGRSVESFKGQIGGEVAFKLAPDSNAIVPIMRLVWNHEFMDDPLFATAGFVGAPGVTFTSPGTDLGSDWATVGFGVSGQVSEGTSFYFRYQKDVGREGLQNDEISAAARLAF